MNCLLNVLGYMVFIPVTIFHEFLYRNSTPEERAADASADPT